MAEQEDTFLSPEDLRFTKSAGVSYRNGKSHYPTLLRLVIPREEALSLAMDLLRRIESAAQSGEGQVHEAAWEFPLFGQIERMPEEGQDP